jgi:hypothetical protein
MYMQKQELLMKIETKQLESVILLQGCSNMSKDNMPAF